MSRWNCAVLRASLWGAAIALGAQAVPPALAQAAPKRDYALPTADLCTALGALARAAGVPITFDATAVRGKQAPPLNGRYTVDEALALLLAGSGLQAEARAGGASGFVVQEAGPTQVVIRGSRDRAEPDLPPAYAGGQVARGGRVGVLGERDVFETPFNVTSFTRQMLDDRQANRTADILKLDPAVRVANTGTSYYEDYLIRGFRVTGNSVAFDGLSAVFPQYAVNLLQGIERVEVFKGANTLLAGLGAGLTVGGAINLVPKRAGAEPVTSVALIHESESRFGVHLDVGRRFGDDAQFGVRVNAYTENGETALDDEHEKVSLGTVALDWRGERARASLDLGESRQDTRGAQASLYADTGIPVPRVPEPGSNFTQPFGYSKTNPRWFAVRGEFDLAPAVTAYAAYGGNDSRYKQLLPFGELKNAEGDIDEVFQNGSGREYTRTWELGLRARFDNGPVRHQLVVSSVRLHDSNKHYYAFDEAGGTQPTVASNIYRPVRVAERPDIFFRDDDDLKQSFKDELPSQAIVDTLSMFDDRLLVTVGARHQRIKSESYDENGLYTGGYDESAVTPTLAVLYKLTPALAVYGNYIEALQSGPSPDDRAINKNDVFPPSRNKQFEAGAKLDLGRVGLTLAGFSIEQPSGITDPATRVFSASGRQRNQGVEFAVFGEPARGWRLNGGLTYVDAKLRKTQDGALDGRTARGVPRTNASLNGEWDAPLPGLTLTAGVVATGSAWLDDENTKRIAAFTVADVGVRWRTRLGETPLTWRAQVANAFDRAYWVADVYGSFYQAAPRTLQVSATMDF